MKTNLILGAATSGIAIARLLLEEGEVVILADDKVKEIPETLSGYSQLIMYQQGLNEGLLNLSFDRVIKSPGLPNTHPLVKQLGEKYFLYSDIEIGYQYAKNNTFGAITGTNGKTTTTSLLTHLCPEQFVSAGNIGDCMGDVILNYPDKTIITELSSYQCEGLEHFKPKVATILNLTPDHLDRYNSLEHYYDTKFNLLKNMDENDVFILNKDDFNIVKRVKTNASILTLSLYEEADIMLQMPYVLFKGERLFNTTDLKIVGMHNIFNAMVAASMAKVLGVSNEQIQKQLKTFIGVKHRLEYVDTIKGVKVYNDSKATNPDSTKIALQAIRDPKHLILGGYDKKVSFKALKPLVDECLSVVVYGAVKEQLKDTFPQAIVVETLEEAVKESFSHAKEGEVLLFSPACASFDQFKSYEHRGQVFKEIIRKI